MIRLTDLIFDHREGEIHLPTVSTQVFRSSANPYVGAQVLPPASRPTVLTLKRYDFPNALAVNRNAALSQVGKVHNLIDDFGINYSLLPYRLHWFVSDVRLVHADLIPAASFYRFGVLFNHSPASRVITRWTLHAIPAFS
ncbi:hypothetical protein [Roseiconus lacunae]|uniref:Uncharacterized protein n=1 Tax=Roseiconus lacunae TaxID=2605694 RepID=A0ABT7PH93_9BACT|nr:hypothetical protein [Roseiconus lacunae]MDM4015861.1 hypothetical protein [Roseiconus lacunae]